MRISKHGIGRAKYRKITKEIAALILREQAGKLSPSGKRHLGKITHWCAIHEYRMYPQDT